MTRDDKTLLTAILASLWGAERDKVVNAVVGKGLQDRPGNQTALGIAQQVNPLGVFLAQRQNVVAHLLDLMPGILQTRPAGESVSHVHLCSRVVLRRFGERQRSQLYSMTLSICLPTQTLSHPFDFLLDDQHTLGPREDSMDQHYGLVAHTDVGEKAEDNKDLLVHCSSCGVVASTEMVSTFYFLAVLY